MNPVLFEVQCWSPGLGVQTLDSRKRRVGWVSNCIKRDSSEKWQRERAEGALRGLDFKQNTKRVSKHLGNDGQRRRKRQRRIDATNSFSSFAVERSDGLQRIVEGLKLWKLKNERADRVNESSRNSKIQHKNFECTDGKTAATQSPASLISRPFSGPLISRPLQALSGRWTDTSSGAFRNVLENNANRANRRAFNWVINAALLNASLKLNFYQLVRVRRSDEDHKLNFPLGSGSISGIVNGKVELSCSLGKRSDLEDPTKQVQHYRSNTTDLENKIHSGTRPNRIHETDQMKLFCFWNCRGQSLLMTRKLHACCKQSQKQSKNWE